MPQKNRLEFRDVLFCQGDRRTKLLKLIDYVLGGVLCAVLKARPSPRYSLTPSAIKKVLVIRPGGIGDAVLLIPFVRELKRLCPAAEIDVLAEKRNGEAFSLIKDSLNEVLSYDDYSLVGLWRKLKSQDYDLVFDTEQWHNLTAILSYLIGKKTRLGFDTNPRRSKFYSLLVEYSQNDYEADSFMNLLKATFPDGERLSAAGFSLSLPADSLSWARRVVSGCDILAAVGLSAANKQRQWPAENFRRLIQHLLGRGYTVVLLGGRKEGAVARKILQDIEGGRGILNFVNAIGLSQAAAALSQCHFYFGMDSGLLHLAALLGISTISLFGPGIQTKWAPRGEKHCIINKNLSCSPCTLFGYARNCRDARCINTITTEEVIAAINNVIHCRYPHW